LLRLLPETAGKAWQGGSVGYAMRTDVLALTARIVGRRVGRGGVLLQPT